MSSSTAETGAVACTGLSVGYGDRLVLAGISLEIARGWTAVVGPNGAGKSTLLRALAGLLPLRTGTVSLYGKPLSQWPRWERARQLAWLSQSALPSDLTARDVVALGRFAHGGWLATETAHDRSVIERAMRGRELVQA